MNIAWAEPAQIHVLSGRIIQSL